MGCNSSKDVRVVDPSKEPGDRPDSANSSDKEEEDNVNEISQTHQDDVETEDSWQHLVLCMLTFISFYGKTEMFLY